MPVVCGSSCGNVYRRVMRDRSLVRRPLYEQFGRHVMRISVALLKLRVSAIEVFGLKKTVRLATQFPTFVTKMWTPLFRMVEIF